MGGQIGLIRDPNELLQKYLPDFTFTKSLNSVPLQHTFMCASKDEGQIVIKFILEDLGEGEYAQEVFKNMSDIHNKFIDHLKRPNVLALDLKRAEIENTDKAIYFTLRQYVHQSLLQRLQSRIPKITQTEKQWFAFQAMCGVSQIHNEAMIHGDIKPENILITSYNQVYLTDMVSYKPTYFKDDDLKHYNHYYGELDNNQKCYFAPERFREYYDDSLKNYNKLERSMDVFSLGCVIAEIFMDGTVLFDLARLQQYRKNAYSPRQELEKKISDSTIVDLIMKMIDIDPRKRPHINDCLQEWNQKVMPLSFQKSFFQLSSAFVRPQYLFSDMKVSLLRKYMPSIYRLCIDSSLKPVQVSKLFHEPIERIVFEKLREDSIHEYNEAIIPSSTLFEFLSPRDSSPIQQELTKNDNDSVLILVHWIGSFLSTCYFPQSRRCALEMLQVIGRASSLEIRLQYILPYIFKMFDDKQSKVQAKAIEAAVMIFENIINCNDEMYLSSTDYKVFDNYIMPQFNKISKNYKNDQLLQVIYTKYLPLLAKIGQKFTEISVTSRLAKKQMKKDQKNGQVEVMEHLKDQEQWPALGSSQQVERESSEIRDSQIGNSEMQHPDQAEIFVNFDAELELLKNQFGSIIKDLAAKEDTPIKRLLFSQLGSLCDFFGSQSTMDNIIPQLHNSANSNKEFIIKIEGLKSVTAVSIKVGKETLSKYLFEIYVSFLNDSEELVVLEIIKTFSRLLQMRLIPKSSIIDDFKARSNTKSDHLFDKLLPFLLHPNAWIREATLNFILILNDYENTKLLSKAEVYCMVGRKLRPYLKSPDQVGAILFNKGASPNELTYLLRKPLSRIAFEFQVKNDPAKFETMSSWKMSESDNYAITEGGLGLVLKHTQITFMRDFQMKIDFKEHQKAIQKNKRTTRYNQYRVVKMSTIEDLARLQEALVGEQSLRKGRIQPIERADFYQQYFQACKVVSADQIEDMNQGINTVSTEISLRKSQVDFIMQALNLFPDDASISLIEYQNPEVFRVLANQSLIDDWRLQIEKLNTSVATPSEIPSFHPSYSRTTSVEISKKNQQFNAANNFCEPKTNLEKFRPQGRLLTTLHEHKNPVNTITVTDDQKIFFTGSRADGMVHGWETLNMMKDMTSHSKYTINTGRIVNSLETLSFSNYLCMAGRDQSDSSMGVVEIYDMENLGRDTITSSSRPGAHRAIVKKIEHEGEGEMMNCIDTMLPVSHQHLLAYTSQKGTIFLHDLRCRKQALMQQDTIKKERGLITCMTAGQDPYQLLCGTIGGYVMIYDIRFDTISTCFKHSNKYPINSIANFKPAATNNSAPYNRATARSPMALIAAGSPNYELSLLDLETGNLEILIQVSEAMNKDGTVADLPDTCIETPSFYRESLIRDNFNWPEKQETNQTLFRRYLMQTRSLINTNQIKLTQNLDDELFKASKNRFKLVKQANESVNACRKVVVPRKFTNLMQGTLTADYAITGGNDMRLRYWNMSNPQSQSYYINTPDNDECMYFSEIVAGGTKLIREQVSRAKNFPSINAGQMNGNQAPRASQAKQMIPGTAIELKSDSVYYSILQNMITHGNSEEVDLANRMVAKNYLTQSSLGDISSGVAHQYQIEAGKDKIMIYNYNGLSEWQHLNGFVANEGNATLHSASGNDMWSTEQRNQFAQKQGSFKQGRRESDNFIGQSYRSPVDNKELTSKSDEYLFRESQNVSHSDAILDIAVLDADLVKLQGGSLYQMSQGRQNASAQREASYGDLQEYIGGPLLITSSRDCTIKLWK